MSHTLEHWIRQVRAQDRRVTISPDHVDGRLVWRVLGPRHEDWPDELRRRYVTQTDVAHSPSGPAPEPAPVVTFVDRSPDTTSTTKESGGSMWIPLLGVLLLVGGLYVLARRGA